MKARFIQKILRNTATGILIGFVGGMLLAMALDSGVSDELKKLYTFVISAVLSLFAAALTLTGVFANIENQREAERRSRERKLAAAKALLPTSLSQMCDICESGMQFSHNFSTLLQELSDEKFKEISVQRLSLPDGMISIFRELIELTDNEAVSERISVLLREYQVLFARWTSVFSQSNLSAMNGELRRNEKTVEWAFLYAITVSLFDYARNESEGPDREIGERELWTALRVSGIRATNKDQFQSAIAVCSRALARMFSST